MSGGEFLSEDFIFIPDQWGHCVVDRLAARPAIEADLTLRACWSRSPATMTDLFMGPNEPDIAGSCMGSGLSGECLSPDCCGIQSTIGRDPPVSVSGHSRGVSEISLCHVS